MGNVTRVQPRTCFWEDDLVDHNVAAVDAIARQLLQFVHTPGARV